MGNESSSETKTSSSETTTTTNLTSLMMTEEEYLNPSTVRTVSAGDYIEAEDEGRADGSSSSKQQQQKEQQASSWDDDDSDNDCSPSTTSLSGSISSISRANIHADYRILALEGETGAVFTRIHGDMQNTLPTFSENGVLEFATRTLLRMQNITVARQLGRDKSMFGPIDYLANLEKPHKNLFTIELPRSWWPWHKRFPRFHSFPLADDADRQALFLQKNDPNYKKKRMITDEDCIILDATWISGKKNPEVVEKIVSEYKKCYGIEKAFGGSVFPDPGILETSLASPKKNNHKEDQVDKKDDDDNHDNRDDGSSNTRVYNFPIVDATELDLIGSGFNCRVVKNDVPFLFLPEKTHAGNWPRPVTYNFQPNYAHEIVYGENSAGLFLETHTFSQSMTPANPDSCGFIVIGKWEKSNDTNKEEESSSSSTTFDPVPKRLHLIALRIPYGFTIIIDKNCMHGDSTFKGLYLMSMTTDHIIMSSADTVFVKDAKTKKNVEFSCPEHSKVVVDDDDDGVENVAKPARVREGLVVYKDATLEELKKFDRDTSGASFVLQPFSKLSWTTTLYRRFGYYPGMPKK